ncbi:MAG: DUF1844 domain-containing protein [Deltaproteobacteria bacterium]|nr:DUF1844 domain-containing protein [Deltaproteobacteria bacterium]
MSPSDNAKDKGGMDSAAVKKDETRGAAANTEQLPPPDFSTFIASLAVSVLYSLGEVADPETGKSGKNLTMARHTIDIIEMLKRKTSGNLDASENMFIDKTLHDLRMKYIEAAKQS